MSGVEIRLVASVAHREGFCVAGTHALERVALHGGTETSADLGESVGVLVVSDGFDDSLCDERWVLCADVGDELKQTNC